MGKKVYTAGRRRVKLSNGKKILCEQQEKSNHVNLHANVFRKKRMVYKSIGYVDKGVKEFFSIGDPSEERCFGCRKKKSECTCTV